MDSNSNLLSMENGDKNSTRLQRNIHHANWEEQQQQNQSTSQETKLTQRRPFQQLNANTSAFGTLNSEMFRSSSSNTMKTLKVCNHIRVFRSHV